ncbi:MAG: InlB B-repeat-containing protein [Clostridia bacterium]|nr:InlB B-repeat-containing protein [Clostridia bacterium]
MTNKGNGMRKIVTIIKYTVLLAAVALALLAAASCGSGDPAIDTTGFDPDVPIVRDGECLVAYVANNGTQPFYLVVKKGETAREPEELTQKGYTFAFWCDKNHQVWDFDLPVEDNTILYGYWTPNTYRITFDTAGKKCVDPDGEEQKFEPVDVNYRDAAQLPDEETVACPGYRFCGWLYEGEPFDAAQYQYDHDITLTAKWEAVAYTATYYAINGEEIMQLPFTVDDETVPGQPDVPQIAGLNGRWSAYRTGACDIVIRAVYTVSFGRYPQESGTAEDIEWVVVDLSDGKATLLALKGLYSLPYHGAYSCPSWEESTLYGWLNSTFRSAAFSEEELALLVPADGSGVVSLLSVEQFETKVNIEGMEEFVLCESTETAEISGATVYSSGYSHWWLSTPAAIDSSMASYVSDTGNLYKSIGLPITSAFLAIRPVVVLDYWAFRGQAD